MKMKQVCEAVGLTEKAVRLYMKQELVHPTVTEGLHNASYDFSEADVERLKIIAALRAGEFSMADIREILDHPDQLPEFLAEHRQMLDRDIRQKQAIAEALDRLSAAESGSLDAAAEALRQTKPKEKTSDRWLVVGLAACCLLVVLLGLHQEVLTGAQLLLAVSVVLLLSGLLAVIMSVRYGTATLRAKKLPHRAMGRVVSVIKQTGFDSSFSIQTTAPIGAPNWAGRGGLWTLFFLLWNEIRPDHWMPVIQFTDSTGKLQSGSFPYGGLKQSFRENDTLEVAWDKYPQRLLPMKAAWLLVKAAIYFVLGAACTIGGWMLFLHAIELTLVPF